MYFLMSVIPALLGAKTGGCHNFETILGHIAKPYLKKNPKHKNRSLDLFCGVGSLAAGWSWGPFSEQCVWVDKGADGITSKNEPT